MRDAPLSDDPASRFLNDDRKSQRRSLARTAHEAISQPIIGTPRSSHPSHQVTHNADDWLESSAVGGDQNQIRPRFHPRDNTHRPDANILNDRCAEIWTRIAIAASPNHGH
jgi:hypothetical protein